MVHKGHRAEHAGSGEANAIWLIIGLVALVGLVLLTLAIWAKVVFPFDTSWLAIAHSWPVNPNVWKALSETANIPLIVIAVGYIVWLFVTKQRREALIVLLLFAAVTAGSEGIKQLTLRPRPEAGTAAGIPGVPYSYPSGHVLEALTILGSVAVRIWRSGLAFVIRLAAPIVVSIEVVLVSGARMALNAHYPTDILAGILGGIGALGLYVWFTRPGAWADRPPRTPVLGDDPG
jgi:undecaprenyl-diphosphatase